MRTYILECFFVQLLLCLRDQLIQLRSMPYKVKVTNSNLSFPSSWGQKITYKNKVYSKFRNCDNYSNIDDLLSQLVRWYYPVTRSFKLCSWLFGSYFVTRKMFSQEFVFYKFSSFFLLYFTTIQFSLLETLKQLLNEKSQQISALLFVFS